MSVNMILENIGFKIHISVLTLTSNFYSTEIMGVGNNKFRAETSLKELHFV